MDSHLANFWIGIIGLSLIFLLLVWRAPSRRLRGWIMTHRSTVDAIASIILIVWGGGIWYLLVSINDYTNMAAMIVASLLLGTGVFFLFRQLLRKI